jgi:GNAT superfamily N-acetyltransferase
MKVMQIDAATPADAEEISALILGLSEPFYCRPGGEGAEGFIASVGAEALRAVIASGDYTYCVARSQGRLAGVVGLRGVSHLFHLFVAEDFQRRGLARQLWHGVESKAMQSGNLGAFTVNASLNAIGVYERFGFVPSGPVQQADGVRFQPMRRPERQEVPPPAPAPDLG